MTQGGRVGGPDVLVERHGAVTVITLDRPERRNALDCASSLALTNALREFDQDEEARAGVLTGSGGHFCAGADLKALATGEIFDPWGADENGPCHDQLSKPLIAPSRGLHARVASASRCGVTCGSLRHRRVSQCSRIAGASR